jgi:hypothetical protein
VPHHGVVAAGAGIRAAIVEIERQFDAGMFGDKRVEGRPQVHATERDRRGDAQGTDQVAAPLRHVGGGLLHLVRDARGPLKEGDPVFGQSQPARTAMHEIGAETSFEFG